tara:strand:- start:314 stop:499 length:186 start_codon:yes stop_codon:yes gene_type:complete
MIEIEESLTVKENFLEFKNSFIECIFEDKDGNKHSRFMKIDLSTVNLFDAKESNELLKQFV